MSGSQISPLTLAMLQAGGSSQMPQDPAIAAALPRLQMAQSLMNSAVSDTPTPSKLGILSHLGQALLGGYLSNQGNQGLQDILKQRQQDSTNLMNTMRGGDVGGAPALPAAPAPQASDESGPPGLINSESSGNPGAMNKTTGALGSAQFMPSRLADLGMYTPAQSGGQWAGTFNIPGFPNVKTQADFVANPAAQQAAYQTHMRDIDQNIAQTPGADKYDANGLRAVAHLGGVGGMRQFIESGGKYNPNDGHTSLMDYYQKFGGGAQTPGSVQVAGPGAPTAQGPIPGAPTAPQPGALPPQVTASNAIDMIRRANDAIAHTAMDPYNPNNAAIAKAAAAQIEYAHTLLSTAQGQVKVGSNGVQTKGTGEQISAATPAMNYSQNPATGAYESPGQKPVFAPTPRPFQTPSGAGGAIGPGGVVQPLYGADNAGVASRSLAHTQGQETGKLAAATPQKLTQLGTEADTAIGNIDYGINQLHEAAKGGINSGYFAPWLETAAAAGKSLGVDLNSLGIKPEAVGNVQSAQKTLGVVAGAILQNTIGKDSAITDAKIQNFIHTQPTLATDPQAIERVLGWARSQFTYNREMAMHGMNNINPETGMLAPGWQSQFYKEKGAFAPIYDPLHGEMRQPQGEGPSASMPAAPASSQQPQQQSAPTYREGMTATGPGGAKVIFRDGQWTPVK